MSSKEGGKKKNFLRNVVSNWGIIHFLSYMVPKRENKYVYISVNYVPTQVKNQTYYQDPSRQAT